MTWTLVGVGILAAVSAIAAASILADAMLRARIEEEVRGAASILAVETDELVPDGLGPSSPLEHEARELGIHGRVAIVDTEAGVIAGDPSILVPPTQCAVVEPSDRPAELACRHELEHAPTLVAVVAIPAARLEDHRRPMLLAGLGVLAFVALGSALAASVLARRLLTPLERLREAVSNIDPGEPEAVKLPQELRLAELEALRDAIAELVERLERELTRAQRFSSAAAHELRTPLAKMRTELELELERELADGDPEARATFERLFRTTDHLVALSQRLLTLATPSDALAGAHGVSLAQLAEALPERRPADEARRLEIATGEADGVVRGDEVLLAAVLDNLVDNAMKFSKGSVRVAVFEEDDLVVVEVDDEGPGVEEEQAEELFEPFQRSVGARAEPGVGLGLALVAHIVAASGGSVGFVPRPRGARVRVRLPHASANPGPRGVAGARAQLAPTSRPV
jgi:two-component system sensor histidine kinase MprB